MGFGGLCRLSTKLFNASGCWFEAILLLKEPSLSVGACACRAMGDPFRNSLNGLETGGLWVFETHGSISLPRYPQGIYRRDGAA